MIIFIGGDHRGFEKKNELMAYLKHAGYEVHDMSSPQYDPTDDYPDIAARTAHEVQLDPIGRRGILICGSGAGMDIVANKYTNIRATLCFSAEQALAVRKEDDANVLCIPGDYMDMDAIKKVTALWLQTPFDGDPNHLRRIQKVHAIEFQNNKM